MITINNKEIIASGFNIFKLPSGNYFSNSKSAFLQYSENDGLKVTAELNLDNIECGKFYINQICKNHVVKITNNQNKIFEFDKKDELFRDTPHEDTLNYRKFDIQNHLFCPSKYHECNGKTITFFDAPFIKLSDFWISVNYYTEFETWFQFSPFQEDSIYSLLSFEWMLSAVFKNENGVWSIMDSKYSDINNIQRSMIYHNAYQIDNSLNLNLQRIGTEFERFIAINKL